MNPSLELSILVAAIGLSGLLGFALGKLLDPRRADRRTPRAETVILKQVSRSTFKLVTMDDLSWSAYVMVHQSRAPIVFVRDEPDYFTRCVTDPAALHDFPRHAPRPDRRYGSTALPKSAHRCNGEEPCTTCGLLRNLGKSVHDPQVLNRVGTLGAHSRERVTDALGHSEVDDGVMRLTYPEPSPSRAAVPTTRDERIELGLVPLDGPLIIDERRSSAEMELNRHESSPVRGGRGADTPRDPDMTVQETVEPGPPGIDDDPAAGPDLPAAGPPSSPKH